VAVAVAVAVADPDPLAGRLAIGWRPAADRLSMAAPSSGSG